MDKSWIIEDRLSVAYIRGLESFLNYACQSKRYGSKIPCPCVRCGNLRVLTRNEVKDHLYCNGFDPGYVVWTWHGEKHPEVPDERDDENCSETPSDEEDIFMSNYDEDMDELFEQVQYQNLGSGDNEMPNNYFDEFTVPLYDGCEANCLLKTVLQLFRMKAAGSWSNKSFNGLLAYIATILPKGNSLPSSMYEAKKIMTKVGLSYDKIHACRNDRVLYRKEFKDLSKCPKCGASRWKSKADGKTYRVGVPEKVMWYLPLVPRLKRLFANEDSAKIMTWHKDDRVDDGLMRHPTDSPQWKEMDRIYPTIGGDARNIRFGLCTDGISAYAIL